MDIPRIFNITESAHRIHNPITPVKLAILGAALRLEKGARVLDLGSGSGEMLSGQTRRLAMNSQKSRSTSRELLPPVSHCPPMRRSYTALQCLSCGRSKSQTRTE